MFYFFRLIEIRTFLFCDDRLGMESQRNKRRIGTQDESGVPVRSRRRDIEAQNMPTPGRYETVVDHHRSSFGFIGPSGSNRPNVFYEPYNMERTMAPVAPIPSANGCTVDLSAREGGHGHGHLTAMQLPPAQPIPSHYQPEVTARRTELIAQPVPLSTVPPPPPPIGLPHNTTLQFANFTAPPRQPPLPTHLQPPPLNGHIPLMLANNGPYHSRVQYYQATSPSPTTYLVSSTERRIDSPMSHVTSPGYLHSPTSSPISSARENDSECERVRRGSESQLNHTTTAESEEHQLCEQPMHQPRGMCPMSHNSANAVRYAPNPRHGPHYSPYTRVSASHNLVGAGFVSQSMAIEPPRFNQSNTVGAPPILTQMRHGPIQHSVIQTSNYTPHATHHHISAPIQISTSEPPSRGSVDVPAHYRSRTVTMPQLPIRSRTDTNQRIPQNYYPQQVSLNHNRVTAQRQRVHPMPHHGLHPALHHNPLQHSLIHTIRTPPNRPHLMAVSAYYT